MLLLNLLRGHVLLLGSHSLAAQIRLGHVASEVENQGKEGRMDGERHRLRAVRGQADKYTGDQGIEQDGSEREHEPVHICFIP